MVNSLLQSLAFRLALSWLLAEVWGMGCLGLFWAECLSPLIPAAVGGWFFYRGVWKKKRLV